jgi:hypothetical protein
VLPLQEYFSKILSRSFPLVLVNVTRSQRYETL